MKKKLFTIAISLLLLNNLSKINAQTGTALNFNGVNNGVIATAFSTLTTNFSMEARVNWAGDNTLNQMIITNGNTGNAGYAVFVNSGSSNQLAVLLSGVTVMQSTATLTVGSWNMVSVVCDAGAWTLYIDGTTYTLTNSTSVPNAVSGNFVIGSDQGLAESFNGTIDEVRFWNRPLSQAEIQSRLSCSPAGNPSGLIAFYNFNEGIAAGNNASVTTLADSSGNGYNLTLNNFTLSGTTSNWVKPTGVLSSYCSPIPGSALNFNGTSNYISASLSTSPTGGTWEAWIQKANWVGNDDRLFGNGINYTSAGAFYISLHGAVGFHFRYGGTDANNIYASSTTTQALTANSWHHLAATWNYNGTNTTLKIYLDATLLDTVIGAIVLPASAFAAPAYIGGGGDVANPFFGPGTMDEVRVWNVARTASEIANDMNCKINSASTGTGLLAYYNFNEGVVYSPNPTITTLIDSSGNNATGTLTGFSLTGSISNWVSDAISLQNLPTVTISASSHTICTGSSATVTAHGATNYTWANTGATSASISPSPSVTTQYTVTGISGNGCINKDTLTIIVKNCTTGIVQITSNNNQVTVYPNPTSSILNIECSANSTLVITDVLGNTVYTSVLNNQYIAVDVSGFANGVYIITTATGKSKFVKQN
jgi:hypothetical protein